MTQNTELSLYGAAIAAALLVSGWQPYDRATWLLEIFPVLIALPVIAMTRERFPLTPSGKIRKVELRDWAKENRMEKLA